MPFFHHPFAFASACIWLMVWFRPSTRPIQSCAGAVRFPIGTMFPPDARGTGLSCRAMVPAPETNCRAEGSRPDRSTSPAYCPAVLNAANGVR